LLAAILGTAEIHQIRICIKRFNKHRVLVLTAYNLCASPGYPEARRIRNDPVVVVPRKSKVAETWRVFLRTPIHGTPSTVDINCLRAVAYRLMYVRMGNHNFAVRWAERSEIVTFWTNHDAGILSRHCEECKLVADLAILSAFTSMVVTLLCLCQTNRAMRLVCPGRAGWRRNRLGSGWRRNRGAAGCVPGFETSG
jgi:hypothetical protein